MLHVKAEDIMSEEVIAIKSSATVRDAAHIMLRQGINGILVCHPDDRTLIVGVLTTTDLLVLIKKALSIKRRKIANLEYIGHTRVETVMTPDVVSVQRSTRLGRIIALMDKKSIHTLPVYDGDKLVGVVGRHDIINAAFSRL